MTDPKIPDNQQFDDNFDEDFNFGEGDLKQSASITTKKTGLNKKGLVITLIVVVGVIGGIGYKWYQPNEPTAYMIKPIKKIPPKIAAPTKAEQPTIIPVELETLPPQAAKENTIIAAKAREENQAISKAFSSTDLPKITSDHLTTQQASKTPLKEPNPLAEQQALFEEKPKTSDKPTPPVATQAEVEQLNQGLNRLNQQINEVFHQIKYLDSYNHEISENLQKLNDSINAIDQRLSSLNQATSTLTNDVGSFKNEMGSVKNEMGQVREVLKEDGLIGYTPPASKQGGTREGTIQIEEPNYRVHAIIPGRAWLKSANGQILTVAEGDPIGNYGKILVIDAANGVVLTSSGIAFR